MYMAPANSHTPLQPPQRVLDLYPKDWYVRREAKRREAKRREEKRYPVCGLRGVWCVACVWCGFVWCACLVQCVLLVRTTYVNTVVTPRLPFLLHLKVPSPRRASKRRAQNRGPHSPVEWAAAERRLRGGGEGDGEGGGARQGRSPGRGPLAPSPDIALAALRKSIKVLGDPPGQGFLRGDMLQASPQTPVPGPEDETFILHKAGGGREWWERRARVI